MKVYLFFAVLILGFFGVITAAVRPDLILNEYQELSQPVKHFFAKKDDVNWQQLQEQEEARWMLRVKWPAFCQSTTSAVQRLECKNLKDQEEQNFLRDWNDRIAQGWRPN